MRAEVPPRGTMDLLNSKVSLTLAFVATIFLVLAPLPNLIADKFKIDKNTVAGKREVRSLPGNWY